MRRAIIGAASLIVLSACQAEQVSNPSPVQTALARCPSDKYEDYLFKPCLRMSPRNW